MRVVHVPLPSLLVRPADAPGGTSHAGRSTDDAEAAPAAERRAEAPWWRQWRVGASADDGLFPELSARTQAELACVRVALEPDVPPAVEACRRQRGSLGALVPRSTIARVAAASALVYALTVACLCATRAAFGGTNRGYARR